MTEWIIRKSDLLRDAREARKIYALRPNDISTDEGEWEKIMADIKDFDERLDPKTICTQWENKMNDSETEWAKNTYKVMIQVTNNTSRIPKGGYLPGFGIRG